MMATEVVSFRAEEETLRFVRAHKLNPNQVAREAFAKEVQRIRAMGALAWLRNNPMRLDQPAQQVVRAMRDEQ